MKLALLAGLLLAAAPALAQDYEPKYPAPKQPISALSPANMEVGAPFKGASSIIIHTTDSASVAYKKIATLLLNEGYTLDRLDKELLFLNTKSRPAPKLNVSHALMASVTRTAGGSAIQLRDLFTMPGAAAASPIMAGETETQYRGMKGSPVMVCWDEMQRLAALYPAAKLTYKR